MVVIPSSWPPEIKNILNTLPPEYRTKITDFINLSYQAGFFDGEGSVTRPGGGVTTPVIVSQDIECLQLYLSRHGGRIGLQVKEGAQHSVYMDGKKVPGVFMTVNRDVYYWAMVGRRPGRGTRSYVEKTDFLLSILPLQHNQSKIKDTIRGLLDLKWSSRARWKHLIPEVIMDLDGIKSSDDMEIKRRLESGMEDVTEWFK